MTVFGMFFSLPNIAMTLCRKRLRVVSFACSAVCVRWKPPEKPVLSASVATILTVRPPRTWAFAMLLAPFLRRAPSANVTNERNTLL